MLGFFGLKHIKTKAKRTNTLNHKRSHYRNLLLNLHQNHWNVWKLTNPQQQKNGSVGPLAPRDHVNWSPFSAHVVSSQLHFFSVPLRKDLLQTRIDQKKGRCSRYSWASVSIEIAWNINHTSPLPILWCIWFINSMLFEDTEMEIWLRFANSNC